jgi:hypothetical protein
VIPACRSVAGDILIVTFDPEPRLWSKSRVSIVLVMKNMGSSQNISTLTFPAEGVPVRSKQSRKEQSDRDATTVIDPAEAVTLAAPHSTRKKPRLVVVEEGTAIPAVAAVHASATGTDETSVLANAEASSASVTEADRRTFSEALSGLLEDRY